MKLRVRFAHDIRTTHVVKASRRRMRAAASVAAIFHPLRNVLMPGMRRTIASHAM
jgi:hypothetical protein